MSDATYSSNNESYSRSTTYGTTDFFSSDQTVLYSGWNWRLWEEWSVYTLAFIAILIATLLCICIGICIILCCKRRKSSHTNPKQNELNDIDSADENVIDGVMLQTDNEWQTYRRQQAKQAATNDYQQIATSMDDSDDHITTALHPPPPPLSIQEDIIVFHLKSTTTHPLNSDDQKKDDSSSNSSLPAGFYDHEAGKTNSTLPTPTGNTIQLSPMNLASINGSLRAATMTIRGSAELPPFRQWVYTPQTGQFVPMQVNVPMDDTPHLPMDPDEGKNQNSETGPGQQQHVHLFPTPYSSTDGTGTNSPLQTHAYYNYNPNGAYYAVAKPSEEGDIKKQEEAEEPKKSTWDESKVSKWVGSRGKKYEQYAQGFVDHGINGPSLCRYGKDETELIKVFGMVVSDGFHRDKLVTDWIALE